VHTPLHELDSVPTPAAQPAIGDGFRQVSVGTLIEKGDEYFHPTGRFTSVALETVGAPVSAHMLVRRIESSHRFATY
jgi:hypothetical protein